ncbi:acetyl-CoA carboxylase biotin carboxyl carrier protein [Limibacillus halophilus]|uniref:Biotin carboxyl carrier protein of acetyl-CoA carboxylase n=1 Tax=Limibacillus halophilus TaxID=1579333 RepID=A0A839SVS1_9PROT|nr:acetyl-CoA carboxylase biotin carboxyl carrier protein [Limibacillus halophilus]MBB3065065.1 acetyl-CoA carboxylase biotin carboxyl carrier protein [Limibacillus halophilus]
MAEFDLNDDLIRRLAGLLEETGLTELEYEADGRRIRVSRGSSVSQVSVAPAAAAPSVAPAPSAGDAIPAGAITAPMVGTVYTAPSPGTPDFVSVGDKVREGQTVLIIEAMKVMNQIAAPRGGTVTQILIDDGQPVEFGEPLIVIE